MAFQDQTLTCRDCGKQFTWTASEQEFYQEKGFQNAPVRCPEDRAAKKARMDGRGPREQHEITCSNCGNKDTVPFKPRGDRPVLCGDCFKKQKNGEIDVESKPKSEKTEELEETPKEESTNEEPEETPKEENTEAEEEKKEE